MARLAIDSYPLGADILCATDYSGLQLYGLGTVAIQECLSGIESSEGDTVFTAHLSTDRCGLGQELGAMFAEGLKLLLAHAPFLKKTVFRNLQSVGTKRDHIQLRLSSPLIGFPEAFRIPNWVAAIAGKPLPAQQVQRTAEREWTVSDWGGKICHHVRMVTSPEENSELARTNRLDFTADTCVEFSRVDDTYTVTDTGLHAHLLPQCSDVKFRAVIDDLEDFNLSLHELYAPNASFDDLGFAPKDCLEISYDDFYPNFLICSHLALHLRNKGWAVALSVDDYYKPAKHGDCKLVIKRPLVNAPLFRAYSMLGFSRTRAQAREFASAIRAAEQGSHIDPMELIEQAGVARPIVAIPSIFWTSQIGTPNPLIRNLMVHADCKSQ
jgi:hypothetical protein